MDQLTSNGTAILALEPLHIYVLAATIGVARMVGLMTVLPVFLRLGLTGLLRGVIGLVLALPVMPMIAAAMEGAHPSLALWGGLMVKEIVVGLLIGMVAGVPIWSAQFAGDVIDSQRNATGQLPDPSSVDASITGTVMSLTIMALYFASGCFQLTLRAVYDSYRTWPADRFTPIFNAQAGDALLGLLDRIVSAGFLLAAPLVVLMLLSDLSIGLLARAAPSMQPYALAPLVKNLLYTVMVLPYFAFLTRYMGNSLGVFLDTGRLLDAMAGGG
jgi:type III secretion protein T